MRAKKPESALPPELHYNDEEAERYSHSTRNVEVQRQLTQRCLDFLELEITARKKTCPLILDIGCGSALSGEVLSEHGLAWVGVDSSQAMLELATQSASAQGLSLVCSDIGAASIFKDNLFDGAISVSVIQWLCHSFRSDHDPKRRLRTFFQWLYNSLSSGSRAVLQFYPSSEEQTKLITKSAALVGFKTFILIDNHNSVKKRKLFLILTLGQPFEEGSAVAAAAAQVQASAANAKREQNTARGKQSHREWVQQKKNQQRKRGNEVKKDSKYTARKRKDRF